MFQKTTISSCLLPLIVLGCAGTKREAPPPPQPAPENQLPAAPQLDPTVELRAETERLRSALAVSDEKLAVLERAIEGRIYERTVLEEANASLELELARALDELLRAQAGIRNVQSRAFAVSRIAEVRVELEAVKKSKQPAVQNRLERADDFLKRADAALADANIGGAAYLAERAGELVRQAKAVAEMRRQTGGETVAIVPSRSLEVLKHANLRRGPSVDDERIGSVEPGETVAAVARQGDWYQVVTQDGSTAWIHRGLVQAQ